MAGKKIVIEYSRKTSHTYWRAFTTCFTFRVEYYKDKIDAYSNIQALM